MTFTINKKDDETFELTCLCTASDVPSIIERSDDYHALYQKKWEYDEESDNFEIYTVSIVKKYPYEMSKLTFEHIDCPECYK
jgi:hypothetical protein